MLGIAHQVLGNRIANLRLTEWTLLAIDDGPTFHLLGRFAVLCDHFQVLDLEIVQVLQELRLLYSVHTSRTNARLLVVRCHFAHFLHTMGLGP